MYTVRIITISDRGIGQAQKIKTAKNKTDASPGGREVVSYGFTGAREKTDCRRACQVE